LSPHVCRAATISDAFNLNTIRSEALEATLDAIAAGVYLVDRLGRVIYMNRAAERQTKTSSALRVEHGRLAPADKSAHISPWQPVKFAVRFFRQTFVAGMDVAWRALHPNLPLQTGFVVFSSDLPHGPARTTFLTIASLMPGTLPAGTDKP
jgi:hypothetical protein